MSVAQVGLEPTASLVLSQGGLPIAYRAIYCFVSTQDRTRTCKHSSLNRAALPIGVSGQLVSFQVVPDGVEPSFPGCEPSVVTVGPRDCVSGLTRSYAGISGLRHRCLPVGRLAGPYSASLLTATNLQTRGTGGTRTHALVLNRHPRCH